MSLRVGILGCGRIAAHFHGPILAAMPGVAVTALADSDPANRRRLAYSAPGANHYGDWQTPIDLGEVDAVVICLPPSLHAPAAIAAFAAGCHVYVEKPMALTIDEGGRMVAAWQKAGTVGMVGFNFRFHPLYTDARRRIARGELGEIAAIRTLFTSARRTLPGWKSQPGAGGDALSDLGTHHFDIAAFLTGSAVRPETVMADQTRTPDGSFAVATARLENDAVLTLTVGQTTGTSEHRVEILGEKGHLTVDLSDAAAQPLRKPPGRFARLSKVAGRLRLLSPAEMLHKPGREPSFGLALSHFVAAARSGGQASPDLHDGMRAMRLVEGALVQPAALRGAAE